MTRKEAYQKIKELNLQDTVKTVYGDNYTRVATTDLEALIASHSAPKAEAKPAKKATADAIDTNNPFEAACLTFLGILEDMDVLDDLLLKL